MRMTVAEHPTSSAYPPWLERHLGMKPDTVTGWPLLATPVRAGFPSSADNAVEQWLNLDDHLVRNPAQTFLLRVAGEGLADAGLHNGDLLVMDQAVPPLAGNVVLAVVDGAFMLTRLSRNADGQRVIPLMEAPDSRQTPDDAVTIAGVARWVIHRLWPGRLFS